jgi:anthranilate phosphoribosyltransferase
MPITAIIFMKLGHNATIPVSESLKKIPEITKLTSVTGDYDLIAEVELNEMERLHEIFVNDIDPLEGVAMTKTAIVMKTLL